MSLPQASGRRRQRALSAAATILAIAIVVALLALPTYRRLSLAAKENLLRYNLFTLRTAIDEYTFDKKVAPRTLQDLVDQGYLRKIPVDPFTASDQTWRIIPEDPDFILGPKIDDRLQPGIWDVHSGSNRISQEDRRPHSDW